MPADNPIFLIAGPIHEEFFLLPDHKTHNGLLGGPALYAAAGAKVWNPESIGLISRVGSNFTAEHLQTIHQAGLGIAGIRLLPESSPTRGFHYYESWEKHIDWDPAKQYAKADIPLPQELMEYQPPSLTEGSIGLLPDYAIRRDDIPVAYHQARAAYIAPCHYQSQVTLSVTLRQSGVGTILLSPPGGLLLPSFRRQIQDILHGIDILFVRTDGARAFVDSPRVQVDELAEHLASRGPKIILLQEGFRGMYTYDANSRRILFTPFYPADIKNPLAIGDSFCGGFLTAWRKTYDPAESTLVGCISASLAMEGLGGLYALQRNPSLAEARLTSLRRSTARQ
jgi:ribokinase